MTNEFDSILSFDPLDAAEKATGLNYGEDPGTAALGFLLAQENAEQKRLELSLRQDTYWGMKFDLAVDVVLGLGFSPVYAQLLPHRYGEAHYVLYWRDGILLYLESIGADLNSARMYFNWRREDGETTWPDWNLGISGGWQRYTSGYDGILADDPWTLVGDIDVREGLKHKLDRLMGEGVILSEWYIQPFLSLVSYPERSDDDNAWRKITAAKLETLPPHLRDMILAAKGAY